MTSTFDKVLMLSGDPTDTTEFVHRHEMHAFNDLVWIGALYCVPMASFQLYVSIFTKVSKGEPVLRKLIEPSHELSLQPLSVDRNLRWQTT